MLEFAIWMYDEDIPENASETSWTNDDWQDLESPSLGMVPELLNMMGGRSDQHKEAVSEVMDPEPEPTPEEKSIPTGRSRAEKMKSMRQKMRQFADLRKEQMFQPVVGEIDVDRVKLKRITQKRQGTEVPKGWRLGQQPGPVQVCEPGVVGSDVEALYPLLLDTKAIMETKVELEGVNYQEGARYIVLNYTEQECRLGPLGRVLPVRRYVKGTRPGITGSGSGSSPE